MANLRIAAFGALATVSLGGLPALADGVKQDAPQSRGAAARAATTSFIWFSQADFAGLSGRFEAALQKHSIKQLAQLKDLRGLFVQAGADDLRRIIEEEKLAGKGGVEIQENAVVSGFESGCHILEDGVTAPHPPWGVARVGGGSQSYNGAAAAWIIDSGVASDYDNNELNVASRRYCPELSGNELCPIAANSALARDDIGHGTMLAGIIGGRGTSEHGVVGVAPGAPVNAVRVFDGTEAKTNLDRILAALLWIKGSVKADDDKATPSPGDVINISLGLSWNPLPESGQGRMEAMLRELADAGFRIAVAAGNTDTLGGSGYVQTVSPARAGGYRAKAVKGVPAGVIMTASAIDPDNNFWSFSAFGNYLPNADGTKQLSLPDFAEPGDAIVSLWPSNALAECSGTSFAAAHLAGLLLLGDPRADSIRAQNDPSAETVGSPGQFEGPLKDPIGIH